PHASVRPTPCVHPRNEALEQLFPFALTAVRRGESGPGRLQLRNVLIPVLPVICEAPVPGTSAIRISQSLVDLGKMEAVEFPVSGDQYIAISPGKHCLELDRCILPSTQSLIRDGEQMVPSNEAGGAGDRLEEALGAQRVPADQEEAGACEVQLI